jgi:hypothetical protein
MQNTQNKKNYKKLNIEKINYTIWIFFLHILYSFQTYTNVPMIYLKHYYKSVLKNSTLINLPFEITKI